MIVLVDMHIRDERILSHLKATAKCGRIRTNADDIARQFACHPNTARKILHRLISAGHITIAQRVYRGGFIYVIQDSA
jgi:hypothetical protein